MNQKTIDPANGVNEKLRDILLDCYVDDEALPLIKALVVESLPKKKGETEVGIIKDALDEGYNTCLKDLKEIWK